VPSVLIADDHEFMRSVLSRLVEAEPDLVLVGTAADGVVAVTMAAQTSPDVVLMDLSMPRLDGISALREIRRQVPGAHVLVLSSSCTGPLVREALRAGACGYLLKGDPPRSLLDGIRTAAGGGRPLAALARELLGS
jgi:DNA-binding NarL/FixJ family response regulator